MANTKSSKSTTLSNSQRKEGFGMKKDQIKTVTNILTNGQDAGQLNAGRISARDIFSTLCRRDRYFIEIADMLTVAATANYLDSIDKDNLPSPEDAAHGLFQKTVDTFREFNKLDENGEPVPMPEELTAYQVAKLMMALCHIRLVVDRDRYEYFGEEHERDASSLQDPDRYTVMLYVADKSNIYDGESGIGTYTSNFWPLVEILSSYSIEVSFLAFTGFVHEVEFWLRIFAKKVGLSYFQGLILIGNGILNCQTKKLMPISPEYVFLDKYDCTYVETKDGPMIYYIDGESESVDDWLKMLRERSEGGN